MKLKPTQILLEFADKDDVEYVNRMMQAKGDTYEGYLIGNLQYDGGLPCDEEGFDHKGECQGCEYFDVCCLPEKADEEMEV